jgi:hypothetical protein
MCVIPLLVHIVSPLSRRTFQRFHRKGKRFRLGRTNPVPSLPDAASRAEYPPDKPLLQIIDHIQAGHDLQECRGCQRNGISIQNSFINSPGEPSLTASQPLNSTNKYMNKSNMLTYTQDPAMIVRCRTANVRWPPVGRLARRPPRQPHCGGPSSHHRSQTWTRSPSSRRGYGRD